MPTFCRHNRFFADCPICSKGTVLDPDRSAGVGLRSMRERAEEVGGTCAVLSPADGGTLVTARLPKGAYP